MYIYTCIRICFNYHFILFLRFVPMETNRFENGMPCQNQKQVLKSERRELEHGAKQVRFAPEKSSSSTSADTARRGAGERAAADVDENTSSSDVAKQIGPQLKLLPLNDQIRELQTIIRDK